MSDESQQSTIIKLIVAMILIGTLMPLALNGLLAFTSTDATVQVIVSTVLPLMIIVGILMRVISVIRS